MNVGIIDYGSGNFASVWNAVNVLTTKVKVIQGSNDFDTCDRIILPGVGTFQQAMEKLLSLNIIERLQEEILFIKKPFLGICVGMQILAEKGFEFQQTKGMGLISGDVKKFSFHNENHFLLPHIGWNSIQEFNNNPLFKGMDSENSDFYFVHSFHLYSQDTKAIFSYTDYGYNFISAVQKENIFGVQFHPEKSQHNGNRLLSNFLNYA